MERILCVLIGYICGLFQTSYLYGKVHGIDIRNYGSGDAGTTNALRTLGAKAGAITLLGDCFKCVIAVVIVHLIFGKSHPEMIRLLGMYAAAGTILGHNFPFYLNFKGGKGIAATAGLLLSAGIIIMGQNGQFTGMSQANIYEMYVLAILLAILAYYKHWPNILRLIHGNENKTYLKKKKA